MNKIKSFTGISNQCDICMNNADWEFEREVNTPFLICDDCLKTIINLAHTQHPEVIDLPYIWFLRTSKENEKNEDSQRIQKIIEEGLVNLDNKKE